jgi:hypothetical protein
LLRDINVARIFWLSQSGERKNSAQPKKWPSMSRNVSLVNGQTDRLALPYYVEISIYRNFNIMASFETIFVVCARKTILGIFFTHSMTLLDRTWSEKSNAME